jgi:transposase InsO family protein
MIFDRDAKWSGEVRRLLSDDGVQGCADAWRVPNANVHAERFVRFKHEGSAKNNDLRPRTFRRGLMSRILPSI